MTLLWQFANTPPQLIVYSEIMEAVRQTWTDDRMDDLVKRVDDGFAQVDLRFAQAHEDIRELRRRMEEESKELRSENKALASELRVETNTLRSEMNRRFDALQTTLIAAVSSGFIGLIISNFI